MLFNHLIDGEWIADGARSPNVNPSDTNDVIGEAVRGTRAQADAAVNAAKAVLRRFHFELCFVRAMVGLHVRARRSENARAAARIIDPYQGAALAHRDRYCAATKCLHLGAKRKSLAHVRNDAIDVVDGARSQQRGALG